MLDPERHRVVYRVAAGRKGERDERTKGPAGPAAARRLSASCAAVSMQTVYLPAWEAIGSSRSGRRSGWDAGASGRRKGGGVAKLAAAFDFYSRVHARRWGNLEEGEIALQGNGVWTSAENDLAPTRNEELGRPLPQSGRERMHDSNVATAQLAESTSRRAE